MALGIASAPQSFQEDVEKANRCLRHCLSVLGEARKRSFETELLLFHPEDFGRSMIGTPASIWQLPEVQQTARKWALHRSAVYQCWFGPARSPSPIAILSSMPHPLKEARRGWPKFRSRPRVDYLSPLPRHCDCNGVHLDRTQRRDGVSISALTESFVNALCKRLFLSWISAGLLSRGIAEAGQQHPVQVSAEDGSSDTGSSESTWAEDVTISEDDETPMNSGEVDLDFMNNAADSTQSEFMKTEKQADIGFTNKAIGGTQSDFMKAENHAMQTMTHGNHKHVNDANHDKHEEQEACNSDSK